MRFKLEIKVAGRRVVEILRSFCCTGHTYSNLLYLPNGNFMASGTTLGTHI
jgi:hypothetical protein